MILRGKHEENYRKQTLKTYSGNTLRVDSIHVQEVSTCARQEGAHAQDK